MAVVSLAERRINLKTPSLLCGDKVNDAVVEAVALRCTRLEGPQLWGTFGSASLSAVATHCGFRLRFLTLHMERCDLQCLYHIAEHCRMLEELQLCSCRFDTGSPLVRLVSSLLHQRELLFVDFWTTNKVLISVVTHLSNLKVLGLTRSCDRFCTEIGAHAVVTSLTHLQRFCICSSNNSVFTPAPTQALAGNDSGTEDI
jgi:hypothetical protein